MDIFLTKNKLFFCVLAEKINNGTAEWKAGFAGDIKCLSRYAMSLRKQAYEKKSLNIQLFLSAISSKKWDDNFK